uniref:Immunoglobulin domain-containing protein n=1 Tax=Myotis lucifugus TaxID=59463 RepID=G1PZI7_MYOLU
GSYSKPSLSSLPSPVVPSGGNNLTLQCRSDVGYDRFALHKEDATNNHELKGREGWAIFPLGPLSPNHGGTYRCYGSSSSYPNVWSQPSAPLHIEVTGMYRKPSLSAQPGPSVPRGVTVTLQCGSEIWLDTFHLHREGVGLRTPVQAGEGSQGLRQAIFPLGPVSTSHGGTYRCYGSSSSYPNVWSQPSDPLHIKVTG